MTCGEGIQSRRREVEQAMYGGEECGEEKDKGEERICLGGECVVEDNRLCQQNFEIIIGKLIKKRVEKTLYKNMFTYIYAGLAVGGGVCAIIVASVLGFVLGRK